MRFIQWEHGIKAIDFLKELLNTAHNFPKRYPQLTWAVRFFNHDKSMPGGWTSFYEQVVQFVVDNYGINRDSAFDTVVMVSKLSMPDDSLNYPLSIKLQHDFSAYFSCSKESRKRLVNYPPVMFAVSDPNAITKMNLVDLQYDSHQFFWELHSTVARPKSNADFSLSYAPA